MDLAYMRRLKKLDDKTMIFFLTATDDAYYEEKNCPASSRENLKKSRD